MNTDVLYRGRTSQPAFHLCKLRRMPNDKPVQPGLAMTPSQIEKLARSGIAVSTPAADQFHMDSDGKGWTVDLNYLRDSDRNFIWEVSQVSKQRILNARKRDMETYT